ncbi:hypothetical protein PVK06_017969 [Gossypium arboreum]|uniref:Uncharacterized protein n=1 Tax=Gossypium arboreum TaxID=29729 RepID=A0ABR0Q4Z5_GOSAR|nr:hypothetical protein PVK06_017969 [Gossypium arboreum]
MGAPTDSTLDLDEQISQLIQCKPLSEQQAKWLNKQLSKLWPFVAEVHTLAFCSGVLDSLAVELKASKDFSKLYGGIAILWLHISLNQPSVVYCLGSQQSWCKDEQRGSGLGARRRRCADEARGVRRSRKS